MLDKKSNKEDIYNEVVNGELKELLKVNQEYFKDREFVEDLVHGNGFVLRYLSKELRDDEEIVRIACHVTPQAVNFASERIINDKQTWNQLIEENPETYKYLLERKKDIDRKKEQRNLIIKFNKLVEKKDEEIKSQKERKEGKVEEKGTEEEKVDFIRDGALKELQKSGLELRRFKDYQNDEEVVITACKNDTRATNFIGSELKGSNKFWVNLISSVDNIEIMDSISEEKRDELLRILKRKIENRTKIIKYNNDDIPRKEMAAQTQSTKSEKARRIQKSLMDKDESEPVYRDIDRGINLPIAYQDQKLSVFGKIKRIIENLKTKFQKDVDTAPYKSEDTYQPIKTTNSVRTDRNLPDRGKQFRDANRVNKNQQARANGQVRRTNARTNNRKPIKGTSGHGNDGNR